MAIVVIRVSYFMFQFIYSPTKAVAKQENDVQLASEQPKIEINKSTPIRFK